MTHEDAPGWTISKNMTHSTLKATKLWRYRKEVMPNAKGKILRPRNDSGRIGRARKKAPNRGGFAEEWRNEVLKIDRVPNQDTAFDFLDGPRGVAIGPPEFGPIGRAGIRCSNAVAQVNLPLLPVGEIAAFHSAPPATAKARAAKRTAQTRNRK